MVETKNCGVWGMVWGGNARNMTPEDDRYSQGGVGVDSRLEVVQVTQENKSSASKVYPKFDTEHGRPG